jgi:hypothetical protein
MDACFDMIVAGVIPGSDKSPAGPRAADRAMAPLNKAVAAGFKSRVPEKRRRPRTASLARRFQETGGQTGRGQARRNGDGRRNVVEFQSRPKFSPKFARRATVFLAKTELSRV